MQAVAIGVALLPPAASQTPCVPVSTTWRAVPAEAVAVVVMAAIAAVTQVAQAAVVVVVVDTVVVAAQVAATDQATKPRHDRPTRRCYRSGWAIAAKPAAG